MLPDGTCSFVVWAPRSRRVHVLRSEAPDGAPARVAMERADRGYHVAVVADVRDGDRYRFLLDGAEALPDPASRHQPDGVHGASAVVDPAFEWHDPDWAGLPLSAYVIYELHVGTFTRRGTFDAVTEHLDDLVELGVTAVELMPVAQFPGARNWGYDGVFPWSVQNTYGGPRGLKALVDQCHRRGLAMVLDVVHNHIGPEGNVLGRFGPYFTSRFRTPWGRGMNFDGRGGAEVRRNFVESALRWFEEFHVDALRLDAIDLIVDRSPFPFLAELADRCHGLAERLGRPCHLIAESDLGDPGVVRPRAAAGLGLDAQWSNDFHHALHAILTGERQGYYVDFGRTEDLARAYRNAYGLTGEHSAYRDRAHGAPTDDVPAERFVVFSQNHDQVGNRAQGERLSCLVSFEQLKLAAGVVILSPFIPLLFMGEEYGEPAPFAYFVHHSVPELVEAVRRGRRAEFAAFGWTGEPPDPQSPDTFRRSTLRHHLAEGGGHRVLRAFHRELLRLRREVPALARLDKDPSSLSASAGGPGARHTLLEVRRRSATDEVALTFNLGPEPVEDSIEVGGWEVLLDSADSRWSETGSADAAAERARKRGHALAPWTFVVRHREGPEEESAS
jgi:maltooligosyltrehalose trehalohydrolase